MAVPPELLAAFRLRYPAMATVSDDTVNYWLDEAMTVAGDNWPDNIRQRAQLTYAAHMITASGAAGETVAEGVSSFRSGAFSATLSDAAASRTGLQATSYGREFAALRAQAFSGPRVY
ncbi:MAG: DUF4054 domain-containing protein [Pseudomonadota bacterium]